MPYRESWLRAFVLFGLVYALVGIGFALPASHVRFWRFAAWIISGVAYAAHIGYEHFRMQSLPLAAALHVASAVALGAFGLAIGAIIHSLSVAPSYEHERLLRIALVAWPAITAPPAFLVALGAAGALARLNR